MLCIHQLRLATASMELVGVGDEVGVREVEGKDVFVSQQLALGNY